MGSSSFAESAFLTISSQKKHQIIAVYTKEPSRLGMGTKSKLTPIHHLANQQKIPVFTPKNFFSDTESQRFAELKGDVAIVISYGILLPSSILQATKFGCFNLHPSALPLWRGAAPLQRSIMAGEKKSAVCVIKMDEGLDSGDIVKERAFEILENDNFSSLALRTGEMGAQLITELLEDLPTGNLTYRKQNHLFATYSKKIQKSECLINWNLPGVQILQQIRALSCYLSAHFFYGEEQIKILEAEFLNQKKPGQEPGFIVGEEFLISCLDGIIKPKILQRAGRKALLAKEFLLGFSCEVGKRVS